MQENEAWRALCRRRRELWTDHARLGQATRKRREARRHTFPLMRAVHPDFGETVVRAESKADAVIQAAKAWGTDFETISREAEVWRM